MRRLTCSILAAALLLFGCTSDDEGASDGASGDGGSGDETGDPVATGPAPGVTEDSVKVGVTFVDAEALAASGIELGLGDIEGAFRSLIDDINEDGGVNGRTLEPVFAPIDPTSAAPAEEACLQLTEDEEVFVVAGFFLGEAVLCQVEAHETAVVGGDQSPELLARARAPWFTTSAGADLEDEAVRALAEGGDLDGSVAVYTEAQGADRMNDDVLRMLEDLGVDVVDSGVLDVPAADVAGAQAAVQIAAERFSDAGAETVLLLGSTGSSWPAAMLDHPYRPQLRFPTNTVQAFIQGQSGGDLSQLEGAVLGGAYGPDQAVYDEPGMQECIAILDDAGLDIPAPDEVEGELRPFEPAFQACPTVALLRALLDAAGEDLNYGTLEGGADGLEVAIPGDPTPRTYGPPPAADGNPAAYLFRWDTAAEEFVRDDDQ